MDSALQTTLGLAEDDSESSAESSKSGESGASAEMPTRLDTFTGLTAAKCDAALTTQDHTGVASDCQLALSDASESDDEPLRLEEDVALHVGNAQDSESDSAPLLPDAATRVSSDWEPGVNMGRWGTRKSKGLGPDAQAMLVNVCLKVKRIPTKVRQRLASIFGTQAQCGSIWNVAGALLCLSPSHINAWFNRLRRNSWALVPSRGGFQTREIATQTGEGDETQNLVRLCLSGASEGRSLRAFERDVTRYALAGGAIGNKNYTRKFAREVEHVGATLLRLLDAQDMQAILPGLGIPGDLAVMFDGVSLDKAMFSRHGSILMIAATYVSPHTLQLCSRMLDAPAMGIESHTGTALKDLVRASLSSPRVQLSEEALRSRLSAIGGDGQIVSGGPDARHGSSKAADLLWKWLHGDEAILCVLWDLFHRADIGAMRAVRECPMANEVFLLAAALDSQFGVNEGRHLFQGVADMLHTDVHKVQGLGGTRKIVAHSSVPRNILHNYKTYVAALHGRLAWKQSGHGKQSLASLISMGRRLCDVSFVSFLWVFSDILEKVVSPFAVVVQGANEPAALRAAERKVLADIDAALVSLDELQERLCVVVLTAQHIHPSSWQAYIPIWRQLPMGRTFPTFVRHVVRLLSESTPSFAGTRLQFPLHPANAEQQKCYGPHCQCVAITQSAKRAARVSITIRLGRRKRKRRLMVPRWVAEGPTRDRGVTLNGGMTPGAYPRNTSWTIPRFQFRPSNKRMPLGWSSNGMFRSRIWPDRAPCQHHAFQWHQKNWKGTCWCRWNSRCHVPESVYVVHAEVNKAIEDARQFLKALRKEMIEILGSVGINEGMKELLESASVCWDWSYLVEHRPEPRHVQAFLRATRLLKPFLKHTVMPDQNLFPNALLSIQASDDMAAQQYMILMDRVRCVAGGDDCIRRLQCGPPKHLMQQALSWRTLKSYSALPVYCFAAVHQVLKVKCPTESWPTMLLAQMLRRASFLISLFMGTLDEQKLPGAAYAPWKVKPQRLSLAGERRTRKRHKDTPVIYGVYSLCVIKTAAGGRLVLIVERNYETSAPDVAAALDGDPWFSNGSSSSAPCCWKVVRTHHRCRVLYPVQATCERLGSFAHKLFEPDQRLTPAPLVDRILLAASLVWCCGSERDEWLVRETTNVLQRVFHKSATQSKKRSRMVGFHDLILQSSEVRAHYKTLEQSGRPAREIGITWDDYAQQIPGPLQGQGTVAVRQECYQNYVPRDLPRAVEEAVRQIIGKNGQIFMPLPVTVVDLHHTQRRWSDSSKSAYLQEWLRSDEGKVWMAELAALHQCDDS